MKTKEELDALKQEVEALNAKLAALSEDELAQVAGGAGRDLIPHLQPMPGFGEAYWEPCEVHFSTQGGSQSSTAGDRILVPFP